jgi:putative addiction module component (TIGR02574 family)
VFGAEVRRCAAGWVAHAAVASYTCCVTAEAERLLEAALKLPDAERAQLAAILADSIGDDASETDLEAAWLAEAKRRLTDIRSGNSETIPWEDVHRKLRAMLAEARTRQASVA